MCVVLDAPNLDSETGLSDIHDPDREPRDDVYDIERSSQEGEPEPRVSLRLGEPRPGHLQEDVCPIGVGMSGWRRAAGRDVAYGLEDDPSGLEAIPPFRGVPFYEVGLQGDDEVDPLQEAATADLERLMASVPA
jgi:hypothetical protein